MSALLWRYVVAVLAAWVTSAVACMGIILVLTQAIEALALAILVSALVPAWIAIHLLLARSGRFRRFIPWVLGGVLLVLATLMMLAQATAPKVSDGGEDMAVLLGLTLMVGLGGAYFVLAILTRQYLRRQG